MPLPELAEKERPELYEPETAIARQGQGEGDVLSQVSQRIDSLAPKGSEIIAASGVATVLPVKFYEGASSLAITPEETNIIMKNQDAPEDEIDIRPNDGLIYVSHSWYRRTLTEAFGPGGWALIPGSDLKFEKMEGGENVVCYRRWVLVAKGCFVGEAIGSAVYYGSNLKGDKSDTEESCASNALRRIAAKSSLGIGSNAWNKRFANRWRAQYAKQVYVDYKGQKVKWWRRIDDEPFERESGDVAPKGNGQPPQDQTVQPTIKAESGRQGIPLIPPAVSKESPEPTESKPTPKTEVKPAPKPETPKEERRLDAVSPGTLRLFFAECRRHGLITGEDGLKALEVVCKQTGKGFPIQPGKTPLETLHNAVNSLTQAEVGQLILKVRGSVNATA